MTTQSSGLIKLSIIMLMLSMFGCSKNSSTPVSPSSQATQPMGTITGLIKNGITNEPVALARISVGYNGAVQSTISDSAGAFAFANVPAGQYQIVNGTYVYSGILYINHLACPV